MSMLAEPRRKVKWSVDPRNSAWSNDDSKFGQKMLERMGWSKGKGLGRSEQGSTDHVKVKLKNDNYGLGTNASYEDNWIAHQDDFNELLAQLNNHHGQNNKAEPPPEEQKGFSLEEKSKMSRHRVHYMKFTKGKDLSSRTETDLNCIFGKRAKPAKDQEQVSNSSDSQDEPTVAKTVTSTLSMQEYFAQRMAQLKKDRGQAQSTDASESEPSPICISNEVSEQPKKKKKKKKSKKPADELDSSSAPIIEDKNQEQELPGKKKKKRRMDKNENCTSVIGLEQNCEEQAPSKKKKKLKEPELAQTEDQTIESDVHKKRKPKEEGADIIIEEKKSKKKKKKKKHQE